MGIFTDRQAIKKWDEYVKNIRRETPVPVETEAEKTKRIARLKKDFAGFCQYYFPNYTTAPFAKWQLRNAQLLIKNDEYYMTEAVFREGAKSVRYGLFLPIYLMFTGELDNMLLVSYSKDNAVQLLTPLRLNLEHNQRLVSDFGLQKTHRPWTEDRFITGDGRSFRAVGAGQSPRGAREEEKRPDFILCDDMDTDEESKNEVRTQKKWDWLEQALYPCFSITGKKRFVVVGNIISKHGIVKRTEDKADRFSKINILDKRGNPAWPERHTQKHISYIRSKISYTSFEKEYMNNPITKGTVFKNMGYGKVPHLSKFKLLVNYLDSSYKSSASKKGDYKAMVLLGIHDGKAYLLKAFDDQTTLAASLDWFYDMNDFAGGKVPVYHFVEVNGLQDPWYEDVFAPALRKVQKAKGFIVNVVADRRQKGDKFTRIEAALEPLDRNGQLIFNEAEKDNPHMQRLREQFEALEPALSAHDDGPDATEGAYHIANNKLRQLAPIKTGTGRRRGKYRF